MTVNEIIQQNEELQLQYSRALETIAKLERKLQKLERENEELKQRLEALQRDHEELRRIMKYYKKKYEKLRDIIVRALSIEKEMGRELTLRDLKRQLTGELTGRR